LGAVPGIAAGGAIFLHGSDVAAASLQTALTGEFHQTLTGRGLEAAAEAAGLPPEAAAGAEAGFSIGGTTSGILAASRAARGASGVAIGEGVAARGAAQAGAREASTTFGRSVQSLKETLGTGRGPWQQASAHAEEATAKAYRGGTSIEEVFVNPQSGERIVHHTVVRGEEVLHETFRPYAKFGLE
jgi:hypothetical protein